MKISADSLQNRVALITGGGSGLGRAAAKLLAHAGAKVAILGRTQSELQAAVEKRRARPSRSRAT